MPVSLLPVLLVAILAACAPAAPVVAPLLPTTPSGAGESVKSTHTDPPPSAGLTYEVYVRSFQDSDGDGIGDFAGVTSRLPYIAELGVQTLWLMPVFPAFGPAGYDVVSYASIEEAYGDAEDLRTLVDAAHELGLRVLLDLPFNHVHRDHPWFVDAESGGLYQDWFVYRTAAGDGVRWFDSAGGGSYYAYFGAEMPDLNWENPAVYAAMLAVFDTWLDAGADGYRLDAVLMLVEEGAQIEGSDASHALLAEILAELRAGHPDAFFLAEASEWEVDPSLSWLGTDATPEADAVLDFPRRDLLLESVDRGSAADLVDLVSTQVAAGAGARMAPFLGSHDVDRLATEVGSSSARRALVVAHLLLPGAPVLYYGEELDLANATSGTGQDYAMRAPMPWDDGPQAGFTTASAWFPVDPTNRAGLNVTDALADPDSMLSLVRALGCVRAAHGLEADEGWTPLSVASSSVLAFVRGTPGGELLVVINLGTSEARGVTVPVAGVWYDVSTGVRLRGARRAGVGTLAGHGWRVYSARPSTCALPVGVAG